MSRQVSLLRLSNSRGYTLTTVQSDARSEILRTAPLNSWVALSDDETRIVAQGATYQEVAAQLDAMGDETSVILKTPASWLPLAV